MTKSPNSVHVSTPATQIQRIFPDNTGREPHWTLKSLCAGAWRVGDPRDPNQHRAARGAACGGIVPYNSAPRQLWTCCPPQVRAPGPRVRGQGSWPRTEAPPACRPQRTWSRQERKARNERFPASSPQNS
jgi:hypothetical protein